MKRIALALAALLLACACGKKGASALPDSWEVSLARAGEAWLAKDMARTWALCENAFTIATAQKKLAPSLNALDCLGEASSKQGQAVKALPFYTRFLADHGAAMATHAARFRILNNHAVLLHESGKLDEAIAGLREVVAAGEDLVPNNYPAYLTLVRNLAIAWYGSASGAEAKAWVDETGAWLQEQLGPDSPMHGGYRGSRRALEALIVIGERQANEATPQWRQLVERWQGREEALENHDPLWRRLCENITLGEIGLVACMREIAGP